MQANTDTITAVDYLNSLEEWHVRASSRKERLQIELYQQQVIATLLHLEACLDISK